MVIFQIFILTMITFQVFSFMGLAGIKLSAVPAVTLILSVGVGVEFTVHMSLVSITYSFGHKDFFRIIISTSSIHQRTAR